MATRHAHLPGADALFRGGNADEDRPKRTEKITVYFTEAELARIDAARLQLREHCGRLDRGRLLRAAFLVAMAEVDDLEAALMRGDGA